MSVNYFACRKTDSYERGIPQFFSDFFKNIVVYFSGIPFIFVKLFNSIFF